MVNISKRCLIFYNKINKIIVKLDNIASIKKNKKISIQKNYVKKLIFILLKIIL